MNKKCKLYEALSPEKVLELQNNAGMVLDHCLKFYKPNESYAELAIILGFLRGLLILHQSHHWQTIGQTAYSDHLLLQRLYETIEKEIDLLGEKIVGTGAIQLTNYFKQLKHIEYFLDQVNSPSPIIEDSFMGELLFIVCSEEVIRRLYSKNLITPGIEQCVGNMLDKHEEHLYLLRQRNS